VREYVAKYRGAVIVSAGKLTVGQYLTQWLRDYVKPGLSFWITCAKKHSSM